MIKYREHRGELEDSLNTAREFSTLKDCLQYVQGNWNEKRMARYATHLEDIEMSYYGYDDRVKQELYAVHIQIDDRTYIVGFIYEETE